MLLNEIVNEVGMTKRAVKYYEEKGLLSVDKDNNVILSILVDTFISKISLPMQPVPEIGSISVA
jgi:hypothetical protein